MAQDTTTQTDEPGAPERTRRRRPSRPHPHLRRVFLARRPRVRVRHGDRGRHVRDVLLGARADPRDPGHQGPTARRLTTAEDIAGKCAETRVQLPPARQRLAQGPVARGDRGVRHATRTSAARTARTRSCSCTRARTGRRRPSCRSRATCGWTSPGWGWGRSTRRSRAGSTAGGAARRTHRQEHHRDADPSRHVREPARFPEGGGRARRRGHVRAVPDVRPAHAARHPGGCQHFDGRTALAYVRTRTSRATRSRTSRASAASSSSFAR
jgi:hypothetical protein